MSQFRDFFHFIETKNRFAKKYGYFECRCICPGGIGLWAAFWTLGEGMFAPPTGSAANGCEIDMFESPNFSAKTRFMRDGVNQATGYDGYDGVISKGVVLGKYAGKNIYTQFNTYGLEWNENEIIFYINGVESLRTSFQKGVSRVPEYVILTLCLPVEFPEENAGVTTDFVVDYVKIYQKDAA